MEVCGSVRKCVEVRESVRKCVEVGGSGRRERGQKEDGMRCGEGIGITKPEVVDDVLVLQYDFLCGLNYDLPDLFDTQWLFAGGCLSFLSFC